MSTARVRQALETALATWAAAQSPAIPIAYENLPFSPPTTRYLRAFLLPARTRSLGLDRKHRSYAGIFQVSICVPTGAGPGAALALADALATVYAPSTPLTAAGLKVVLTEPSTPGPALQEPGWHVLPVSVPYQADTVVA